MVRKRNKTWGQPKPKANKDRKSLFVQIKRGVPLQRHEVRHGLLRCKEVVAAGAHDRQQCSILRAVSSAQY